MVTDLNDKIRLAAEYINAADALLITAGAGIGVDSGLPDFRGNHGFWREYPVIARLGLSFAEIANPAWFRKDPFLAWAFYGHRLNLYRSTSPHAGFHRLLEVGRSKRQGYFVFTSNVDGQFQKAGFAPDCIVECHGSIHHFQCSVACTEKIWDAEAEVVNVDTASFRAREPLPKCRHCAALARPNILMFGDWGWLSHRTEQQHDRFSAWLDELRQKSAKVAVIELGAGEAIPTVRHTSEGVVESLNGRLVRINPREHSVPVSHIGLPLGAAEGIGRICDCAENLVSSGRG